MEVHVAGRAAPLRANAVLCTLPLGVLKAGVVEFDPPLPGVCWHWCVSESVCWGGGEGVHARCVRLPSLRPPPPPPPEYKQQAIAGLGVHSAASVALVFDQAFWPEELHVLRPAG